MIEPEHIAPFTEHGFVVTFGGYTQILNAGLHAARIGKAMAGQGLWLDVSPAINSLAARYDPLVLDPHTALGEFTRAVSVPGIDRAPEPAGRVDIPVLYGGAAGPDMEGICADTGLTPEALTRLHTGQPARVICTGFAPGFAYMNPLPEGLRMQAARRRSARICVPAGSIAIADDFTGIYSLPSPGGWQIIGRTPARLFDPGTGFLLQPNIEVRFRAIDEAGFTAHTGEPPALKVGA